MAHSLRASGRGERARGLHPQPQESYLPPTLVPFQCHCFRVTHAPGNCSAVLLSSLTISLVSRVSFGGIKLGFVICLIRRLGSRYCLVTHRSSWVENTHTDVKCLYSLMVSVGTSPAAGAVLQDGGCFGRCALACSDISFAF